MVLVQQGVERQSVGWRLNVCDTQTSCFIAIGIQMLDERPTLPGVLSDELRRSVSHTCRALLLRDYSPAPVSLWRDDPPPLGSDLPPGTPLAFRQRRQREAGFVPPA